jgi:Family of unknown function (DUF6599)
LIRAGTSASLLVSNIIGLMKARSSITAAFCLLFLLAPALRAADVQWPAKIDDLEGSGIPSSVPAGGGDQQPLPVLKEAGIIKLGSRNYRSGDRSAQVLLYSFQDSSGAYQAFTSMRAEAASGDSASVTRVNGNLVVWIHSNFKLTPEELRVLDAWEQSISDGIPSPPIATYLPDQSRQSFSERYALGPVAFREAAAALGRADAARLVDVAGFDSHAEAMFAKYKAVKDEATLLLIEYPTPQLAELHLRHLQRGLRDAKLSTSSIERKGSLLSIVLAPTSAEYAEKLRAAVNYETEVTWNEPSTTATDPPITSTLVKIIIATMVLMGMAFVLGIAFGGVRVITKRLFPGKVFDRPAQMEVLQLGLSGKPIDPRDMY